MWAAKKLVTSRAASRHEIQQHSAVEKGVGNTLTATLGPVITRDLYCHVQNSILGALAKLRKVTLASLCLSLLSVRPHGTSGLQLDLF
jgi:hypothetical protein